MFSIKKAAVIPLLFVLLTLFCGCRYFDTGQDMSPGEFRKTMKECGFKEKYYNADNPRKSVVETIVKNIDYESLEIGEISDVKCIPVLDEVKKYVNGEYIQFTAKLLNEQEKNIATIQIIFYLDLLKEFIEKDFSTFSTDQVEYEITNRTKKTRIFMYSFFRIYPSEKKISREISGDIAMLRIKYTLPYVNAIPESRELMNVLDVCVNDLATCFKPIQGKKPVIKQ